MNIVSKDQLREHFKGLLTSYTSTALKKYSSDLNKNLFNFLCGLSPYKQNVAGYYPIKQEISILPSLHKLHKQYNSNILLPKIYKDYLIFNCINYTIELKKQSYLNKYSITELQDHQQYIPNIVIAPMLAFNVNGDRIGYGKGFYDNTLTYLLKKHSNILFIGVAYDFQQHSYNISSTTDVKLNVIITNKKIYGVSNKKQ